MEVKENVSVEIFPTESGAKAQAGEVRDCKSPMEVSTVWEKFKDADALAKAYGSLQAEFTRRSQKIKELEKQVDNLKAQADDATAAGGAGKLRRKADERKAEEKEFDKFVFEIEQANYSVGSQLQEPEKPMQNQDARHTPAQQAQEKETLEEKKGGQLPLEKDTLPPVEVRRENGVSSEELFQRASSDEQVRLRIIGEYLSSLGKTGAPLMRGGAGVFAAPPLKAKSVKEAGNMALRFFQER